MTVTLKFQSSGIVPGDGRPVSMRDGSLTVGRGEANDLVLPDPDRILSKSHCVIEDHNGNVVILDLSTNGTYLNYSKIALGQTPTPLNDGDVLSLGGYELLVEIGPAGEVGAPSEPAAEPPLDASRTRDMAPGEAFLDVSEPEGDFLDDLLGAPAQGPAGISVPDPIDELLPSADGENALLETPPTQSDVHGDSDLLHGDAMSESLGPNHGGLSQGGIIPDDWDADPFEHEAEPTIPPRMPEAGAPASPSPVSKAPTVPGPAPAANWQARDAGLAYLANLDPGLNVAEDQLEPTLARLGRVTRAMIVGIREILMTRAAIKGEFRIDQTRIAAGDNNPLKFSITPEQAIEALTRPQMRGYLDAETATREALQDIKAHEVAVVTGMEAALKGVLKRLDPEVLISQIETRGDLAGLFKGRKARYWEIYEDIYAEISDQAENDFYDVFSREFAQAYNRQLKKLKDG